MSRLLTLVLMAALVVATVAPEADAISRVGRSLNYLEVFAGHAKPVGEVEFVNVIGPDYNYDTEDLYGSTYFMGVGLGQVRAGHLGWGVGFRFTKMELSDDIDEFFTGTEGLSFNQYDVDLNINYYLTDVASSPFAPYVGLGVAAGLMSPRFEEDNFEYDSELKALAGLNFGFDLRLSQNADGSQVSLVSMNRYDFMSTSERPHYLNIGVALRYYVRP
ncbi:MAG: hypothetical protein IPH75_05915 [bacterium]|nr:hypothetical protein [bacterium]